LNSQHLAASFLLANETAVLRSVQFHLVSAGERAGLSRIVYRLVLVAA
jgi:hypothetical protein